MLMATISYCTCRYCGCWCKNSSAAFSKRPNFLLSTASSRRGAQQVDTGLPPRLRGGSKDVTSLVVATNRCISLQGGRRIASIAAMRRAQRNGMTDPRSAVAPSPACGGGPRAEAFSKWTLDSLPRLRGRAGVGARRSRASPHTRIPPMSLQPTHEDPPRCPSTLTPPPCS